MITAQVESYRDKDRQTRINVTIEELNPPFLAGGSSSGNFVPSYAAGQKSKKKYQSSKDVLRT